MSTRAPDLPARPPLLTVALLSAGALAWEILLMRLFSIIQWHHFAWMIISLALLGYGASGTFLAFARARLLAHYPAALQANLLLFAATAMPGFLVAQQIPFNPEQMLWNPREMLHLVAIFLILSLPFFFAANAIALTLAKYRTLIGRVYAVDLLGAGIGSIAVVMVLMLLPPAMAPAALSVAALACLPLAAYELKLAGRVPVLAVTLVLVAGALWLGSDTTLRLSPYKDVSQTLRASGARLVDERYSPLAVLQVIDNDRIPLRYAPGLSLNARRGPPPQLGLFADGNRMGAITRDDGRPQALEFLDQLTAALPWHLKTLPEVLVIGAGGGMEVLQARRAGARHIDAVELNPQVVELVDERFADFSGGLYRHPDVQVHIGEGRGFIESTGRNYDLIQLSLQAGSSAAGGLYGLSENYLFTIEALEAYLGRLKQGGYLAIGQWTRLPPRASLKLFATAIEALKRTGAATPAGQLMLIRGWQTSTLLVADRPFDAQEIRAMKAFCKARSFDPVWYPGMQEDEANRFNRLRQPWFHLGARALLGPDAAAFVSDYKFDLRPASDDRPYFSNFFKWSTLPEILSLREQGGLPLLEAGYPVLVATLAQAMLASSLLILLPLLLPGAGNTVVPAPGLRLRVVLNFAAIGLAFLFVEIAFIQKFMRFLHHPLYTTPVVLASFLVFAGLGSQQAQKLAEHTGPRRGAVFAVTGIVLSGLACLAGLDLLFSRLADWPMAARIGVSVASIAPLAFFMGMPFPLALTAVGRKAGSLIPLAWAVNGCASVISAVLATLLAIHFGFSAVVVLALFLYAASVAVFPSPG